MRCLLLPLLLLGAHTALAQAAAPAYNLGATHRYVQATQLWPQVQSELKFRSHDYLLLAVQGRRTADASYGAGRNLGFDTRQLLVGYEHFAGGSKRWSYGGTARLLGTGGPVAFIPEALLRHRAPIFKKFVFGQRLSVERTFSSGSTQALESGPKSQFWTRLRVDVARRLALTHNAGTWLVLYPRLSYEAATHLRLQKEPSDPDERTIQYTSLRAELGLRAINWLDVTPWFAYQTRYLETLPQYDAVGNPTAGGKLNAVYPTVGLDLRIRIRPTVLPVDLWQTLPTQH